MGLFLIITAAGQMSQIFPLTTGIFAICINIAQNHCCWRCSSCLNAHGGDQDLFRQLQKDHVIYAEIRFAPCNTCKMDFPRKKW